MFFLYIFFSYKQIDNTSSDAKIPTDILDVDLIKGIRNIIFKISATKINFIKCLTRLASSVLFLTTRVLH